MQTPEQQEMMRQQMMMSACLQLLLLVGLLVALAWGYCERQRRRRIKEEQGGFPARSNGDMESGLFECFTFPRICLPACFFTPVLAAFNRSAADNRDCGVCDVLFSLKTPFTQYQTRASIRAQHQLVENECTDCLSAVCCTPCAVGQDALELERREAPHQNAAAPIVASEIRVAPGAPVQMLVVAPPMQAKDEYMKVSTDQV